MVLTQAFPGDLRDRIVAAMPEGAHCRRGGKASRLCVVQYGALVHSHQCGAGPAGGGERARAAAWFRPGLGGAKWQLALERDAWLDATLGLAGDDAGHAMDFAAAGAARAFDLAAGSLWARDAPCDVSADPGRRRGLSALLPRTDCSAQGRRKLPKG